MELDLRTTKGRIILFGGGALVFMALIVLVVFFSSLFAPEAVAEAPPTATPLPTEIPMTPTPMPTLPPPLPTATPIPLTKAWASGSEVVYLWDTPDGKIMQAIPNGDDLMATGNTAEWGGFAWVEVVWKSITGWVVDEQIHDLPYAPLAYVTSEDGANMRDQPSGGIFAWLPPGTPIMEVLEEQARDENNPMSWVRVRLPDNQIGWVAKFTLEALGGE
ncbi:MAG: SH3 domain-containing protein [Chloroflexi bacterium]|jgi:hypothetical protein|nr:SH3 domain-containing protein [Chloroflexota bacterium]